MSSDYQPFYVYSVVTCTNEQIRLNAPFHGKQIRRKSVGVMAVIIDLMIMVTFLGALWVLQHYVQIDS